MPYLIYHEKMLDFAIVLFTERGMCLFLLTRIINQFIFFLNGNQPHHPPSINFNTLACNKSLITLKKCRICTWVILLFSLFTFHRAMNCTLEDKLLLVKSSIALLCTENFMNLLYISPKKLRLPFQTWHEKLRCYFLIKLVLWELFLKGQTYL